MGYNVLGTLYQLELSFLEVLFIYTIKMSPKEYFSLSTHILSLQFVIGLPNFSKGWAKGHVLVSSPWSWSIKGLDKLFKPTWSLEIPSTECFHDLYTSYPYFVMNFTNRCSVCADKDKWVHFVKWVDKSLFTQLNKLFEID